MFKLKAALAVATAMLATAASPAFAGETFRLTPMLVADIGRDVDALAAGRVVPAKIVRIEAPEMPALEQAQNIAGSTAVKIDLDGAGKLTGSSIFASSGHPRFDAGALSAVRGARYAPAMSAGRGIAGSFIVEVSFNPASE